MEWLKKSILAMDNKTLPTDQAEIKKSLNEIKQFRLEEYASRLKEKKRLIQLSDELTSSLDDMNSTNIENETKSVEKVWLKFDNYVQMRESLLEKTLKKFETFQTLINKINKLYNSCDKRLTKIKADFDEISPKLPTMSSMHFRSHKERFNELFIQCDNDLRKMTIECQHLKDEEQPDAEKQQSKIDELQKRCQLLKSDVDGGFDGKSVKPGNAPVQTETGVLERLKNYLFWINEKTNEIQKEEYPEEFVDIERELNSKIMLLSEIKVFREKYSNDLPKTDEVKYNINELEIAYNLLFNETNHRIKCLHQMKDLVELVNNELTILDQKEEIELSRDWSSPSKLHSSELKNFKVKLDCELNDQILNKIEPALYKGKALIDEKHPASNILKIYVDALANQLEWIKLLSYMLGVHTQDLADFETFNFEIKELNSLIDSSKRKLIDILSNSGPKSYLENIEKTEQIKNSLQIDMASIEDLVHRSKSLKPFVLRKQKLISPKNRCKCLVDFANSEASFRKNEECVVDDNTQRLKWKIITEQGQSICAPSVCFTLLAVDEDAVTAAEMLVFLII